MDVDDVFGRLWPIAGERHTQVERQAHRLDQAFNRRRFAEVVGLELADPDDDVNGLARFSASRYQRHEVRLNVTASLFGRRVIPKQPAPDADPVRFRLHAGRQLGQIAVNLLGRAPGRHDHPGACPEKPDADEQQTRPDAYESKEQHDGIPVARANTVKPIRLHS
jgi:hypothetical protein